MESFGRGESMSTLRESTQVGMADQVGPGGQGGGVLTATGLSRVGHSQHNWPADPAQTQPLKYASRRHKLTKVRSAVKTIFPSKSCGIFPSCQINLSTIFLYWSTWSTCSTILFTNFVSKFLMGPSNIPSSDVVDEVGDEVYGDLDELKEAGEGDLKIVYSDNNNNPTWRRRCLGRGREPHPVNSKGCHCPAQGKH